MISPLLKASAVEEDQGRALISDELIMRGDPSRRVLIGRRREGDLSKLSEELRSEALERGKGGVDLEQLGWTLLAIFFPALLARRGDQREDQESVEQRSLRES